MTVMNSKPRVDPPPPAPPIHHLAVYIAGPMTGIADFNYPAFDAAEKELRELGFAYIINPANTGRRFGVAKSYDFYLRESLRQVLTCEAVALLDGWESSKGAILEYYMAKTLGLPIFQFPSGTTLAEIQGQQPPTYEGTAFKTKESAQNDSHSTNTNSHTNSHNNLTCTISIQNSDGSYSSREFVPGPGYAHIPK